MVWRDTGNIKLSTKVWLLKMETETNKVWYCRT